MTFEAISTLSPYGIDGSTIGYQKVVYVNYVEAVHDQYADQMEEILKGFDRDQRNFLIYHSFIDLEEIAQAIAQLNDLYKGKLAYNSSEWLRQNPLCRISFCYERVEKDGYYISLFGIPVDQFAELFHKDYQINEENKNIEFSDHWDPLEGL